VVATGLLLPGGLKRVARVAGLTVVPSGTEADPTLRSVEQGRLESASRWPHECPVTMTVHGMLATATATATGSGALALLRELLGGDT
jgi:hypothetical protein